jgi:hypothetical protein
MFDVTGTSDRTQGECPGAGPCIRLRATHPSHYRAARLLSSLGGSRCLSAPELSYRFVTPAARDEALRLVRRTMGWSVASPFDGGRWRRYDPATPG